jgi:hypothetical protein
MMAKHLWAASRLVVEPAAFVGWSRQQAIRLHAAPLALAIPEY